jgi:hypothetical protein
MGIFDFIGRAYSAVVTGAGGLITTGIESITGEKYGRMTAKEFREEPVGAALTKATTITTLALGVVTLPFTVPVVVKAAIAKPVVALIGAGLVSTAGGRELIGAAAEGLFIGGEQLGLLAEELKEEGKELTIGEGLKAAGLVGAGIAAAVGIPIVIEKVKEFKEKIPEIPTFKEPAEIMIKEKAIGVEGEVPILPETTTITVGKKLYKRRRAKITQPVKQYVRVNIINRNTSTGIRQSI